jgi:hypothetical protein
VLPAQQRLDADHAPADDVELGLVLDLELRALEGLDEVLLQRLALAQLGIHGLLEEAERPRRLELGASERLTGMLEQRLGLFAIAGRDRDPDAQTDVGKLPAKVERFAHGREQALA